MHERTHREINEDIDRQLTAEAERRRALGESPVRHVELLGQQALADTIDVLAKSLSYDGA